MKCFWVFAFHQYYPGGGMSDFQDSFETRELAQEFADSITESWDHIEIQDISSRL